ncbi:hypothetical protein GCM10009808_06430 [Microbacterium sediminicola]|uniref:DUF559 domain-containing protein n=1 Tax=Microbacterium sediminicola TaxID=415210 RepID=A0ABN2HR47_9MICO
MDARSLILTAVRTRGGVARVRSILAAGHSRHHLSAAISDGTLQRIRRGWVALPDAPADLVRVAEWGVVLSCITLARRQGLWVLEDPGLPHVAADQNGPARGRDDAVVHWRRPAVPRHPDALVDSVDNALVLIATCQPHEVACATWESAFNRGVVRRESMARLSLPPAARVVLDDSQRWSDSGLESLFVIRLRWMRIRIVPQAWIAGHRVDFLIGERLVVQIDGATHVGPQRTSDIAHDAELLLQGYHVIRLSYTQVVSDWVSVQDVIMRAVGQGLHRAR